MMNRKSFARGLPVALFIFAGNMLAVGKGNLAEILLSAVFGVIALPIAAVAASAVFGEGEKKGLSKIIFIILTLLAAIAAIYVAAITVNDFSRFVEGVMLLRIPRLAVGVIFVALCSYLFFTGNTTVKKFAFVGTLIVCASVIILFALSFQSLEADRIYDIIKSTKEISAEGIAKSFSLIFAPAVIAVIYISAENREKGSSVASFWGAVIAVLLLTVCFLNVFLLLGGSLAASEDYPYATAEASRRGNCLRPSMPSARPE